MQNPQNNEFFQQITQQTIYLMGISFVLGSLVTIFILLILNMVRTARLEQMEAMYQRSAGLQDDDADSDAP